VREQIPRFFDRGVVALEPALVRLLGRLQILHVRHCEQYAPGRDAVIPARNIMTFQPTVRPARYSDRSMLVAAHAANRSFHHPWCSPFTDDDGFDAWWGSVMAGPKAAFVACDTEARLIGVVNLTEIVFGCFRSAYVAYHGTREHCGHGLMTEVVRMVTRIAFDDFGLHRLEANIQPMNQASIRLVERLGFVREGSSRSYLHVDGEWRDHERWALLANAG
jgi:ribosomal-protein-alanine N-acetyltransferase